MPQMNAYLSFNGTCAEAMRFYAKTLGGELQALISYGDAPMEGCQPPADPTRIMHACIVHPEFVLMAGDAPESMPYAGITGISMTLSFPTVSEARRIFDILAEGGRTDMPPQETFWAEFFGMTVDRYGVPWLINGGLKQ